MWLVRVEAKPDKPSFAAGAEGAIVNVWVRDARDADTAVSVSQRELVGVGWRSRRLERARPMRRDEVKEEHLPFFDEADEEGVVLVFYCWPDGSEAAGSGE